MPTDPHAPFTLIATATFGLETVVGHEVRALGYEPTISQGRVTFSGDAMAICRANLWLRSADRVQWRIAEFTAKTFDELYDHVRALPWGDLLPRNAAFPVTGKSVKSQLHSLPSCQSIIKKAIVDTLGQYHGLTQLPEDGPSYSVQFQFLQDRCLIVLDTSGIGLHKRGYRSLAGAAPLKETLAAGLVLLSRWHPNHILVDPCCGTGTIPIEAAMIGLNMAPGRNRQFASSDWPQVPEALWAAAREEADALARPDRELRVFGSDMDGTVLKLARYAAEQAGLTGKVFFEKKALKDFRSQIKYGYLITNPPYGERLGDRKEAETLYREMGAKYTELIGWGCYVMTAHQDFETFFDWKADKKRKLYNGNLRCDLYQYKAQRPPRREAVEDASAAGETATAPDAQVGA